MVIILILSILLMRVVQSFYGKRVNIILPDGMKSYIFYVFLNKIMAAGFAMVTYFTSSNLTAFSLNGFLIAACSGVFLALGSFCGIKVLKGGTIVLSSVFGTAGLIVPIILGIFVFDEKVSIIQFLLIALLLFSTALMVSSYKGKKSTKKLDAKTIFYLVGNMLTNGMVMFCQKLFGKFYPNENVSLFSLLTFLIPASMLIIFFLFIPKKEGEGKFSKKIFLYSSYLALAVFIIQQFVTILTPKVSSVVLFTFVNGAATVISAIVGATVYKEKMTLRGIIGLVLGIGSMILIKILE